MIANTPARSATAGSVPARPWPAVTREVAGDRVNRIVFAAVAAVAALGYSVLLPFDYTQRVSFANWQYFGPRYAAFTVEFALGLAWVVTLQVHAMRWIARTARRDTGRRRGGLAGALAAVVSLLPSLLCCSPVVPALVGLIGLPAATRLRTTGTITYFFATRQDWLLGGALAVLAASGVWSVRKLARASCLAAECCDVPAARGAAAAWAGRPGLGGDREPGQPAHGGLRASPGMEAAGERAPAPVPRPRPRALRRRRARRLGWAAAAAAAAVAAIAVVIAVTAGGRDTTAGGTNAAPGGAIPAVGSAAPDGTFTTVSGRTVTIASLRGRKTLLWFVATWCPSCQAGTQAMAGQAPRLRAAGVKVIEVEDYADLGQPGPPMSSFARQFASTASRDPGTFGTASPALTRAWNPHGYLDVYFLLGSSGRVAYINSGPASTMSQLLARAGGLT